MRWVKHMTASADDEKLSALMDEKGLEGYGFWWRMVEIIGSLVDGQNEKTSATYPFRKWGSLLGVSPKKFQTLVELCANLGLFSIEVSKNSITVNMPNILKYRDEFTRKQSIKSGKTPDKIRTKSGRDTDTDTDTDISNNLIHSKKDNIIASDDNSDVVGCSGTSEPPIEFQELRQAWDEHARNEEPLAGLDEFWQLKHSKQWPGVDRIFEAMMRFKAQDQQWIRGYPPGLAKFLRLHGWLKLPDGRILNPPGTGKPSANEVLMRNAEISRQILEAENGKLI